MAEDYFRTVDSANRLEEACADSLGANIDAGAGLESADELRPAKTISKDINSDNIHRKHRQRMKERYLKDGLDGFAPHEVMEFLLYYAVPYKDTNATAHAIINRYGSFAAALAADPQDLQNIKGLGEHSAILLSLMPKLFRYYQLDKWRHNPIMDSTEAFGSYGKSLFIGHGYETFYMLCLNSRNRLIHTVLLGKGTVSEVMVYVRLVVEAVIRYKAKNVVLMHNHPSGSLIATTSDISMTQEIMKALSTLTVSVLDHIIVADDKYLSFFEKGLLVY